MINRKFIWGAASSAFQIEGGIKGSGKGKSIWDVYFEQEARFAELESCNHYLLWEKDVNIMKDIGISAYRFSINWTRIIPDGIGKVNIEGIDFYRRLIEKLLENGIEPYVTIFHWDYPYELYRRGGWLSPDSSKWFEEYTYTIIRYLGDGIKNWLTINEPQVFAGLGMQRGKIPPNQKYKEREIASIVHNILLAHGKAVRILRNEVKEEVNIGFSPVLDVYIPKTSKDVEVAKKKTIEDIAFYGKDIDLWNNRLWVQPIYEGRYPEEFIKIYQKHLPKYFEDDLKIIGQDLDFFGCNVYSGREVEQVGGDVIRTEMKNKHRSAIGWDITPEAIYWASRFFYERYKKKILITENGVALSDWIDEDGEINDVGRIDYINKYIKEIEHAINDDIDIIGYFYWSLIDNLEWEKGYNYRFGLVYNDFDKNIRIMKKSAYWYKNLIEKYRKDSNS